MEDTVDGVASSPDVADPIQERTDNIKYPTWQPECRAVMLEIDPIEVQEKLAAAEAAMAKRLPQITASESQPERRALKEQGEALELAVDKIPSQHPDVNK
jgi:hypothetical protein